MQEEQRVIEAKIRMRQQELQDEEVRMLKKQESGNLAPTEVEYSAVAGILSLLFTPGMSMLNMHILHLCYFLLHLCSSVV